MKATYFILFLFICACFQAEAQSLDEYMKIAEENNPSLKSRLLEFEVAMQRIPQVGSLPDPGLKVTAFGQMVETRVGQQMARFSLEQMFPWFGTLAAQKDVAALAAQAKYELYLDGKNELAFQVRSAYYALYELEQQLKLQRENLEIFGTYKTLATARFQNGNGKLADALQVDIMTNELQTEISILESKRKPLLVAFNRVLNRSSDEEVVIADDLPVNQESLFLLDSVLTRNPKLSGLDQWIASAQAQQEVAKRQSMPMLGIGFEYIVTA